MMNRRRFLASTAAGMSLSLAVGRSSKAQADERRPRIAFLGTVVHRHAHAQHFLDRLTQGYTWAGQWQTPIIAYRDFTRYLGGFPRPKGNRVRAVLDKDTTKDKSPSPGTNTPFAEVMFPLSLTDMIVVKP